MENKEKILQHLDKIEQYALNHPWLMEELRRRFGSGADGFTQDDSKRLEKIEQYLSLDYDFLQVAEVAGYDYVEVARLKEKMVLDWREMMRYRYGIGARPISFVNFCSHAHFQAEAIINYYHFKRDNGICDIDWFNQSIKDYMKNHPTFKLNLIARMTSAGKPTTLDDINYNTKKSVLLNVFDKTEGIRKSTITEIGKILLFLQRVRNTEAVHRSPTDDGLTERTYSYEAIEYALSTLNSLSKQQIQTEI